MSHLVLTFALFVGIIFADIGDIAGIDFTAADPYSYNHNTGGGAYNDGGKGDVVEQLNGGNFKCGEYVSFIAQVVMRSAVVDATQCVLLNFAMTADTTGKTGLALGDVVNISINRGLVENGNNPRPGLLSNVDGVGYGKFAYDGGHLSLASTGYPINNEVAIFEPDSDYFASSQNNYNGDEIMWSGDNSVSLFYSVKLCGLEKGETIIFRVDAEIFCKPGAKPTGNIQGALLGATYLTCAGLPCSKPGDTGGAQTIPLTGAGDIVGSQGCSAVGTNPIIAPDFTADIVVYDPEQPTGTYRVKLWYSWRLGTYKTQVVGTNIIKTSSFDIVCGFLHDGIVEYAQSGCGCEATFVAITQPQLFFSLNASYYNTPPTNISNFNGIAGLNVMNYTRSTLENAVKYLYVLQSNPNVIVQAEFYDGLIWNFYNYTITNFTIADFTLSSTTNTTTGSIIQCDCKRSIVLQMVLQRDARIFADDFSYVTQFAGALIPNGFPLRIPGDITSNFSNTLIGVTYYDTKGYLQLSVVDGTSRTQVSNSVGKIGCTRSLPGSGLNTFSCGDALEGSILNGFNIAKADLLALNKPEAQKVILIVAKGFTPVTSADMQAAVNLASSGVGDDNIKVFAVAYESPQIRTSLLNMVTDRNLDYFIYKATSDLLNDQLNEAPFYNWPQDVLSRICVAKNYPCGEPGSFCGVCDETCGGPNTTLFSCTPSQNCTHAVVKNAAGCCIEVTNAVTCLPNISKCEEAFCNASSGQCYTVPTCQNPTLGNPEFNCYNYSCVVNATGHASCVKQPLFTSNLYCSTRNCTGGATPSYTTVAKPDFCSVQNDLCYTYTCEEGATLAAGRCKPTARIDTDPNRRCRTCINNTYVPTVCNQSSNKCIKTSCDPETGTCSKIETTKCNDPSNKCDLSTCNTTTGNCTFSILGGPAGNLTTTDCPKLNCSTYQRDPSGSACNPGTGNCTYDGIQCGFTLCCGTIPTTLRCDAAINNCTATCPPCPTPAPTPAPTTKAPTTKAPTTAFPTFPPGTPTDPPSPEPTEEPTTEAPTPAPTTEAPTPLCTCPESDACNLRYCNLSGSCVTATLDCNDVFGQDSCFTVLPCNVSTLPTCQRTSLPTCPPPSNNCSIVVRDGTSPTCCSEIPKTCSTNDCFNSNCDPSSGLCVETSKCTGQSQTNKCVFNVCNGTHCNDVNKECPPNTFCSTFSCNSTTGECDSTSLGCSGNTDLDLCSSAFCNESFGCQVSDVVICPILADKCLTSLPCNPATGTCGTVPVVCDDNILCTVDTCNSSVGCVFTPLDSLCNDPNPCVVNETCNVRTGCSSDRLNCTALLGEKFCESYFCADNFGCSTTVRNCVANVTNGTCNTWNCSETKQKCLFDPKECFDFKGVVVGIIVGALIGGLVAAAIFIAGISAGGAAAAYSANYENSEDRAIKSNPLFQPMGKGAQGLAQ